MQELWALFSLPHEAADHTPAAPVLLGNIIQQPLLHQDLVHDVDLVAQSYMSSSSNAMPCTSSSRFSIQAMLTDNFDRLC